MVIAVPASAESTKITIGTGGVTGVYYPAGGAICRLVNKGRKNHGIRCAVESTDGSVYNLKSIQTGDLEMGIAQSDWLYHAYNGTSIFREQGAIQTLRSLFSIHPEPFTIVARADSGIHQLQDLKGKRINIGNPGSGQRGTMDVLMNALGWTKSTFSLAAELNSSDQSLALCENKIDAMVFTEGHPSGSIKEATSLCDTVLVNVTGPAVNNLVKNNKFYRIATIPGGMYRGNPEVTQTFGVGATLIASTEVSTQTVYQVIKSVFGDFDNFRKLYPALNHLNKTEMANEGLSAPLHDGAVKYYKEAGLIKE